MMIKIDAIIREERFEDVKEILNNLGVNGMTVSQVMGCGVQKGYKHVVRGMDVEIHMLPKIKLEIVVESQEMEEEVIAAICSAAYTGQAGDGKIFTYEIRESVRIRTRERGEAALKNTHETQ